MGLWIGQKVKLGKAAKAASSLLGTVSRVGTAELNLSRGERYAAT